MKEQWSISKDKLVDLEEGTSRNEEYECAKPAGRSNVCEQAIECVKLILYLGLLMVVGWACYSMWQTYQAQPMEVKVTDIIRELESQNLLLLEKQRMHETSTIAARPFYGTEDSLKRQDAVDDLQKLVPDDQGEIIVSENTESSHGWPTYTDYPALPEAMNFSLFLPSFSGMEVDDRKKEPGSSESAQRSFDNISEESQQLKIDEKILLENYMLLSLLVQNAVRISENLKDSKEVVDPKFEFKLKDLYQLQLKNSGPLELEDSSRLKLDNSGPLEWFNLGQLESQKEIGSDLEDSEEKPSSAQTDDSTEPKEEETLIKSNEQMHQSMDSGVADWFDQSASEERKHEEEQSLLEKSAVRNAEAVEDSREEVDRNFKLTSADLGRLELEDSGLLEMKDSSPLEYEDWGPFEWKDSDRLALKDLFPLDWEDSGPLESQKEIGSDLEDPQEKPSSTQTDDN